MSKTQMKLRIDESKPLERLQGMNLGIVRQVLGRTHVGVSYLSAIRAVRKSFKRGGWAKVPKALKRGLILDALEIHTGNRRLYYDVMGN